MWSPVLLSLVASQALAALVCQDFVPADLGWSFNLASGYLTANPAVWFSGSDNAPDGSELQLDQSSPFGVDGQSFGTSYIFTLLNCTDKSLGIESRVTNQCYPASDKKHHANTTTRTDFLQIQSNNNVCLTVANPHRDQTELNYTACDSKPRDLRQLFKSVRTTTYPQGTCGDLSGDGPYAAGVVWEEKAYCGKNYHWHLVNDTDFHSRIILKKNQALDERFVFFDEAG